ncbi:F-box/WD repeat-containing protein 8-like [Mytilus californianus]|uniref:F-box/WD repeat-containing protein 8-like n=1 Tax=Mytilus californianus TaxID=6549 RepID=UPI0022469F0E|nr:F-box/WD repeat-containing protein 8-like [Mytilus californianus]
MASNDLEKFRTEWKNELQGSKVIPDKRRGQGSIAVDPTLAIDIVLPENISNNQKSNPTNCSECRVHPAFRENNKCHTCLFITKQNKEHKTNTQFYPFRIVDGLLNSKDQIKQSQNLETEFLSNTKVTSTCGKKRKYDAFGNEDVKDIFSNKQGRKEDDKESYLDLFIADLDEINEIPFFDLTVPREVAIKIFEPLDLKDLCRCSQVSKSWKSLADDELLWCRICHKLGYEQDTDAVEKRKWKTVVRHHIEVERKLVYNWKNRLGSFTQLQHVHGGILCAVNSSGDNIVAGYTNGDVKLWNVSEQFDCLYQPSNTSLVINENTEDGTIPNHVTHVGVSPTFVVAAYRQGNVDIWKTDEGDCTVPVHVIECHDRRGLRAVGIAQHSDLVYTISGPLDISFVHICQECTEQGFNKTRAINIMDHISASTILEEPAAYSKPQLVIATKFHVNLYKTEDSNADIFSHVTNIHNVIGSPVTCMDVRSSPSQLAVGLGSYGGALDPYRVKVYDANSGKLVSTLYNHTWTVTCVNIADSPDNLLTTGSGDRRVRVFDLRSENMTHLLSGHSSQVNTVQMDDIKIVSGGDDGFVRVWDLRMTKKLWEIHNRHPVKHCHFTKDRLILGNVPTSKMPFVDEFESVTHRRYRGSIQIYDFSVDQTTQGVPDICLSTYDEPEASHYNISLAMPYDKL